VDTVEMGQITYFQVLSQELNFTRAAQHCKVSQPSLTRAIRRLEEELGGILFHRERNATHLSELGLAIKSHFDEICERMSSRRSISRSGRSWRSAPGIASQIRKTSSSDRYRLQRIRCRIGEFARKAILERGASIRTTYKSDRDDRMSRDDAPTAAFARVNVLVKAAATTKWLNGDCRP
jgi:DNA-binding transcriptional LysR family regulator